MTKGAQVRKLLVVTWPILPGRGGSVIIIEKLFGHFTDQEVVLLGELPPFGKAPVRQTGKPRAYYFRSGFSLFGRGARFFSWFRWLLLPLLIRRICRTARTEQCDYILGIFPDDYYCYAACLAAKRLGLPFSTYFHNTYTDNEAVDQKRGRMIQPLLFSESEHVFVMSDGMKRFFEQKYGFTNVTTLVHTFEELPGPAEPPAEPLSEKQQIRLVLFGNFNSSNIEATQRFLKAISGNDRYRVFVYTHVPVALLKLRGIDTSVITHMGYIDDADLVEELRKYDICVLTHGFTGAYGAIEYRTIFPTRTIPMLLSGRPIFVHSPPDSFLSEFVREHNIGLLVDTASTERIVEGLDRIVTDASYTAEIVEAAGRTSLNYFGPNVAAVMRQTMRMTNALESKEGAATA
ncbi:MAG: glycosyltransferase [Planctomycetaceae bacterium]